MSFSTTDRLLFAMIIVISLPKAATTGSMNLECDPGYELKTIESKSMPHIGKGTFLVSVCCPSTHQEAVYFGREGVGCCEVKGQKCLFKCKCRNNKEPRKSKKPKCLDDEQNEIDCNTQHSKKQSVSPKPSPVVEEPTGRAEDLVAAKLPDTTELPSPSPRVLRVAIRNVEKDSRYQTKVLSVDQSDSLVENNPKLIGQKKELPLKDGSRDDSTKPSFKRIFKRIYLRYLKKTS